MQRKKFVIPQVAIAALGFVMFSAASALAAESEFQSPETETILALQAAVRADVMYGQGRLDQALIEYEDAIRVSRFPVGLRLDRGPVHAMKGAVPKALAEFGTTLAML